MALTTGSAAVRDIRKLESTKVRAAAVTASVYR
jgi:hypothetical protein